MKEPLEGADARRLLSELYQEFLVFSPHARERFKKHRITEVDVVNVLRCGRITEPAEFENGTWRYRVHTWKFCAVVAFRGIEDEDGEGEQRKEVVVVTTWRKSP
jgi:hypothetical protein